MNKKRLKDSGNDIRRTRRQFELLADYREAGRRVKVLRERAGYSVTQVSQLTGLEPGYLIRIEMGMVGMTPETTAAIGALYAVKPRAFHPREPFDVDAPVDFGRAL